ncbi:hypothetical protein JOQ06_028478 [Pogonophryne albipinna]|uniref:DUF6729 domain-containing protein n=1 Tax=Pogonophryne albipinna TaxID=1090488 RepID=A0AAD6FKR2_9TELE|nr:hypothetical protein JOQ06_028478 [Pogonophryne albipinna]
MQKHCSFFPGRMTVTFRKGPLGYLRQDPTDAARLLKDNPIVHGRGAQQGQPFLSYALSFGEIQLLRDYEAKKTVVAAAVSEDEQLVGFGNRAKNTWRDIWDSRDDGYAAFIVKKKCAAGTRMHRLQQYLQKKLHPPSGSTTTHPSLAHAEAMGMDQDEELEQAMLSMSPSKHVQSSPALPVKTLVPLPKELMFLMPEPSAPTPTETNITVPGVYMFGSLPLQRIWMKMELQSMGLWPGSVPVRNPLKMVSLWRGPPQPELIDSVYDFPCAKYFQLHPFFIWKPENDNLMGRVRNNYTLPCIDGCAQPQIASAGVGRPRVIVGTTGQYYLLSSRLCCKVCWKRWYADNPSWLEKLPKRFTNLLPAVLTYKKAICKSVLDELRRSGKSPTDMAKQITELMHLKYERADLAYLLSCKNIMDGEEGKYDQRTITQFLRQETKPAPFGEYGDSDGWNGISVSAHYLTDCLLHEYEHQQGAITKLLQGTFGQAFRSDHTRKVARKVTFSSGTMSSYAVMNENWMILSWVMVQSETEKSLKPLYQGLEQRYRTAGVEKAQYHWVDRDCCAAFRVSESCEGEHLNWDAWMTSDAIAAQATSAFSVVDQEDLQRLKDAYAFCGIQPANPTKPHTREHCRIRIPHPEELIKRVEGVFQHFHLATDPNGHPLFKASMLKCWRIQRIHILRGCLSDPEVEGGIMYRHGGTLQLNHVPGEGAKVPVWIPIRGTSQQEGYHFHQAQWVTGTRVSTELFQAQAMTGVARWNYQRLVDLKQPDVKLPAVFDPALMGEINAVSQQVFGHVKYPAVHLPNRDTGEKFGLEYVEPDCRPVPLDWDKHRSKADSTQALDTPPQSSNPTAQSELLQPPSIPPTKLFQFPANPPSVKQEVTAGTAPEPHTEPETTCLTDPKMPFGDFAETAFFPRELEAMKQRVEARVQLKRKNTEPEHKGRKCGFCRKELKQGPNSPHIHTGFPGVAGKDQGMEKQMTWKNFKESVFYEAEKRRWEAEKGK